MGYPGARGLIVRKTRASLSESGLVTYEKWVLGDDNPIVAGPTRQNRMAYRYPNGSTAVVGGMDKAIRIMSTEYDVIYIQEATELLENDLESLTTRLRNGVVPYQLLIGDCNPDAPTHWLKRRADRGASLMMESRHEDNPVLFTEAGELTDRGRAYIAKLDALTGVRYRRLRLGQWAAAEGAVYQEFDRAIHLLDRFEIPREWRRIRVIDFGYTNPFVCQWWAIDGDGRMYLYREIYQTKRTVRVHAERILQIEEDAGEKDLIEATIADHDAEDRATLEEYGIYTIAARKEISRGIQKVQERVKVAGDGRPRLFMLRDALVSVDEDLEESRRPFSTEQEIDGYVWPKGADGKAIEERPVKTDDHGMDAMRYAVAYVDGMGYVDGEILWVDI
jgi:phage terminase large subunit